MPRRTLQSLRRRRGRRPVRRIRPRRTLGRATRRFISGRFRRRGVFRRRRRFRRVRKNIFNPQLNTSVGSEDLQEYRQTKTDGQCAYFGHGTPVIGVSMAVCRAFVVRLMQLSGINIRGWMDEISGSTSTVNAVLQMRLRYTEDGVTFNVLNLNLNDHPTWNDLAYGLNVLLRSGTVPRRIDSLSLYDITVSGYPVVRGILYSQDIVLHFNWTSLMKFQNQTRASVEGVNMDLTTDVGANPLVGKIYIAKKWQNGFIRKFRGNSAGWTALCDPATGFIATGASQDAEPDLSYYKPPAGFEFNAKAYTLRIGPGQIGEHRLRFSCKIRYNSLLIRCPSLHRTATSGAQGALPLAFGKAALIALEKQVDSGGPNPISLGVQLDQKMQCYATRQRPKITRNTYVQTAAPVGDEGGSKPEDPVGEGAGTIIGEPFEEIPSDVETDAESEDEVNVA